MKKYLIILSLLSETALAGIEADAMDIADTCDSVVNELFMSFHRHTTTREKSFALYSSLYESTGVDPRYIKIAINTAYDLTATREDWRTPMEEIKRVRKLARIRCEIEFLSSIDY